MNKGFSTCLQLLVIAAFSLLLGVIYYWHFRQAENVLFLAAFPEQTFALKDATFFTWPTGWIPTFLHVFAFSIISSLVLGERFIRFSCVFWGIINAIFEIGQSLPADLVLRLPETLNLQQYLINGTFDPFDLVACGLGAWAAWRLIENYNANDKYVDQKPLN